ncbi:hypothetical protein [Ruegeria sp. 6PALISEP08]|uniref:hypothetical protein n=1 Tax=Ruegeria sp. 6PALISEP08 TaxID=1225660 RepID=UPI00067EE78F|nr:hypothetical protein [Ruegeria sp. 6PALISEP08]
MKRIFATLIGTILATGLVLASPSDEPEDLAERYLNATDEAAIAATWKDWHPKAVHTVTIKFGLGQPDETFSYPVADWETLPDWHQDPTVVDAKQGYRETRRNAPTIASETTEGGTRVTATTRVEYIWGGTTGTLNQTDEFLIVSQAGRMTIRALDTTLDYR